MPGSRRDPPEERGPPRHETHRRETREGTLGPANLSTQRRWIAELARKEPHRVFTSLDARITEELKKEYRELLADVGGIALALAGYRLAEEIQRWVK